MNDQTEILERCHIRAKGAQTAHLEMAARYRRLNNLIGPPTATLVAALGTTTVTNFIPTAGLEWRVAAGIAAVLVTVLAPARPSCAQLKLLSSTRMQGMATVR